MVRRPVSRYPSYLLKAIPPDDRKRLSEDAAAQNISVTDIIRRLLCDRYKLHCPPESYGYQPGRDGGGSNILLRLQPNLALRLDKEAAQTGSSKRGIILEAIASHYQEGQP